MRVRVLGPLEIYNHGEWRRPGTAKQRSLLAALVVAGGNTVSTDRLTEAVWNRIIPATAVNLIQGHVVRVRRALGDPTGELLRTDPPGYRLVLGKGELDSNLFERLVEEGTAAMRDDHFERASTALTKALGLWRGPAFAEVPMPATVETEANRLEQLRLTALETRIDADLELGRHNVLVPELQQLVDAHQLREPFWGQLMRALYRSGRRADALATYERLRDVLDAELRVKPMKSIQDLRDQILADGKAIGTSHTGRGLVAAEVPRQLPMDIGGFTSRATPLSRLDTLIGDAGRQANHGDVAIVVITGPAGVGKSSLAVHWAHRIAHRYPDGQLHVDLRGFAAEPAVNPADAVRDFLQCLGMPPNRIASTLAGQVSQFRSLLANRRVLILLDNAFDVDQVRPLLPGASGSLVVVTSRNQLSGLVTVEGAHPVAVDPLTPDEARCFLARRIGRDRTAGQPRAVNEIIDRCGGLPLPLAAVAARAAIFPSYSLEALATELRETTALDAFVSSDASVDVRASLFWSYRGLSEDAARLFRLLGRHSNRDVSVPAAATLAGLPPCRARRLLAELGCVHLLRERVPGKFSMHGLVHAYAAGLPGADLDPIRDWSSQAV